MDNVAKKFDGVTAWIKETWNKFDLKELSQKLGGSSVEAVQAALFFIAFFALGFFFKKYFKFLLSCLIASFIFIKVMEYNALLTIDWEALRLAFGIEQTMTFNTIVNQLFDWVKANVVACIASMIGFLIGYKLG